MTTAVKAKRAVGYFRVSDPHQTGERHSSLETQENRYLNYCKQNHFSPVATFTDVVTGRRDDRKDYLRMVEFVMHGGADIIVMQYLDRFGRNPREILRRYWELQDHGISIVATDEDIREEIILLVKAGVAGAESKRNSERVRANMGTAVKKGVHVGRSPYGLKSIKDVKGSAVSTNWELDATEAAIVREMYRLRVEENLGYKSVADKLTGEGYKARGGHPFAAYTVERILSNPALIGTLVYGTKPRKGNPKMSIIEIPGFFPPILSPEEWQRLRERRRIRGEAPRGKAHSSEYLLSGIARCGHCGGPMVGKVGYSYKGKQYRNYYCSRATKSRGLCPVYNGHSVAKLENAILKYLGEFSNPNKVRQYLATAEKQDTEKYEVELRGVEKRLADLESQFLTQLDGLLKRKVLSEQEFVKANEVARSQKAELEARRAELANQLKHARASEALVEKIPLAIKTFEEAFHSLEVRQQKAQLQTILKAAHICKDGRIELEFRGENTY
jgi:DNA invertase Pin-like site-specific DNA recombinase